MRWYYLLASLPPLTSNFGDEPPISVANFWRRIRQEAPDLQEVIQAALLIKDITNLEQADNGLQPATSGSLPVELLSRVLTDSLAQSWYLPEELALKDKWQSRIWETYFQYAMSIAEKHDSSLAEWLTFESGLRRAFERARAETLGRSVQPRNFASEDIREQESLVDLYRKASNPMEAEKLLDQARWKKIAALAMPYTFDDSEVVAYALRLLLVERWWTISESKVKIFEKVMNG